MDIPDQVTEIETDHSNNRWACNINNNISTTTTNSNNNATMTAITREADILKVDNSVAAILTTTKALIHSRVADTLSKVAVTSNSKAVTADEDLVDTNRVADISNNHSNHNSRVTEPLSEEDRPDSQVEVKRERGRIIELLRM